MNTVGTEGSKYNILIWLIVAAVLCCAAWANFVYAQQGVLYRSLFVGCALIFSLLLAAKTTEGKQFLKFFQESRAEIRKIVWPTRQETVQTTGLVVVIVLLMGIFLWLLDAVLFRVMGLITG